MGGEGDAQRPVFVILVLTRRGARSAVKTHWYIMFINLADSQICSAKNSFDRKNCMFKEKCYKKVS